MMNCNFQEIFLNILVFLPAISSLTCGMIFFMAYQSKLTYKENLIRYILIIYFAVIVLWYPIGLSKSYDFLLYVYPLVSLGAHISQVLFYHFISVLTDDNDKNIFSYHYCVPLLLFAASSFFFYTSLYESGRIKSTYNFMRIYSAVSSALYMIYYTYLSAQKVTAYRKILNKQSEENIKHCVNWIFWLIIFRVTTYNFTLNKGLVKAPY